MFSLILSFVLFLFCIPLKAVLLGLQMTLRWYLSRDTLDARLGRGAIDAARKGVDVAKIGVRAGVSTAKFTGKLAKVSAKVAIRMLKLAIRALKLIILLVKVLIWVFTTVTFMVGVFLFIGIIVVIASAASFIMLLNGDGLQGGSSFATGGAIVGDADSVHGYVGAQSDGTVMEAINTLGQWMISDVAQYNQGTTVECPYLSELDAEGNIVTKGTMRPDCTGFAQAVVRYLAGEKGYAAAASPVSLSSSHEYLKDTSKWRRDLEARGWQYYSADIMTTEDLQPGDLLIRPGHAEFYLSSSTTWGWGSVKTKMPSNLKTIKKDNVFVIGGKSGYCTVYRYVGMGGSSQSVESEE